MPTIGETNHAILRVELPEGSVFCDPTERAVPFGALPVRDQGAPLLAYTKDGAELVRSAVAPPEQNVREEEYTLKLSSDGSAHGRFSLRALGEPARYLRGALIDKPKGEWADLMTDRLWLDSKDVAALAMVEALDSENASEPLLLGGEVTVRKAISGAGQTRLIRPSELWWRLASRLPTAERKSPIVHSYRDRRLQRLVLGLPAGYEVASLPDPVSLDGPYGSYALSWSTEGGCVVLERRYEHVALVVPAEECAELKGFYDKILAAEDRPAVLTVASP